ncbi:hypothetical protein ACCUM_1625 [Candidatus Accumulibacter phosphatis]|uniref:Uncharacterized protein n=1 Tax=Candidatus Accumulibacter phosphatis TaxID=327160 RepID=A0A5S4ESH6_9PROT|nr:hypothetical protein ACCUM_1625 [Candidatus Accumulibacter phosphatis]
MEHGDSTRISRVVWLGYQCDGLANRQITNCHLLMAEAGNLHDKLQRGICVGQVGDYLEAVPR